MVSNKYLILLLCTIIVLGGVGLPNVAVTQRILGRPDFFEKGQEQLEQEVRNIQQPPNSVVTIKTESQQWQPIIFETAGFVIWMPLGAKTSRTKSLQTAVGKLDFEVLTSNIQSSRFVVAHANYQGRTSAKNPKDILAAIRDAIVSKTEFKVKGDRPLPLDAYPGEEITLQKANETIIFRMYSVQQHMYILASSQPSKSSLSQATTVFFNSFQLLK